MKCINTIGILLLILFSGCSISQNEMKELSQNYTYGENVELTGELLLFENQELYFVIQDNQKFKLENCNHKKIINFGDRLILKGFVYENDKFENVFYCGDFENQFNQKLEEYENLTSEVEILKNQRILIKTDIIESNLTLNGIKDDIENLGDEKLINSIEREFRQSIVGLSNSPPLEEISMTFRGQDPIVTSTCIKRDNTYNKNCILYEYTDKYYQNWFKNYSYVIYFYGIREGAKDYYKSFNVTVEYEG